MQKVQKNILYSVLLTVFTLGLYGCSCSQVSKDTHDLAPGLYLSELSVTEGNSGNNETITLKVTLEREDTDEVTVSYSISAIDPDGRTAEEVADFAIVGTAGTPGVDVIESSDVITFSGGAITAEVNIELNGDLIYEHNEKFLVTLSAASAGVEIVKGSVEAVILNDDAKPIVSMASSISSISEVLVKAGETSPDNASITLSLNTPSRVDAAVSIYGNIESSVDTSTSKVGRTAAYRADYHVLQNGVVIHQGDPIIIPAGESEAVVELEVIDDGIIENDEQFFITLSAIEDAASNAQSSELEFVITDNDSIKVSPLNDTGLLEKPVLIASPEQDVADANIGLDKTLPVTGKTGGGRAGFDYTRLDSSGAEFLEDPVVSFDADNNATIPWECVRDNVSGLVWEVKTRGDVGLRSESRSYYWYDPNYETNGGNPGEKGSSICRDRSSATECNAAYYVADVNHAKLCGMTGWRLPTIEELRTIVDYGVVPGTGDGESAVAYDTSYFIGDERAAYFTLSSTTDSKDAALVRVIRFRNPIDDEAKLKTSSSIIGIRLVNDSLQVPVQ